MLLCEDRDGRMILDVPPHEIASRGCSAPGSAMLCRNNLAAFVSQLPAESVVDRLTVIQHALGEQELLSHS